VQRRIHAIIAVAIVLLSGTVMTLSCNKLDTTNLGGDLIPAVDNVTTFADTLPITTTQGYFNNDTTEVVRTDDHIIGRISNDPLFGTTNAAAYFELKPGFYPYYIGNAGDTINPALVPGTKFDSVVLVMNYKGFYGDTTTPIQLQVSQVNAGNPKWDSTYAIRNVNYAPTTGTVLGTATIDVRQLPNYFFYTNRRDSANNQIRIKLSTAFMNSLVSQDTLAAGSSTNGFRSDSLFKSYFKGFAVKALSGNGLLYSNLADTNTKLEIHYVRRHGAGLDTAYSSFKLNSSSLGTIDNAPSITVNNIVRNRVGFPVSTPSADAVYIQTAPGTYVNLSIPGLTGLSNRIIHRAELTIQQIPDNTVLDGYFPGPPYLYLDLVDTTTTPRWKPIYYDLDFNSSYDPDYSVSTIYFPSGGVNHTTFGGVLKYKTNSLGANQGYYTINMTRYVQQIVTKGTKNYNLRLWAPYDIIYPQYSPAVIPYNNPIANGRIKVGSGSNTNLNYRMILRLVYSNI